MASLTPSEIFCCSKLEFGRNLGGCQQFENSYFPDNLSKSFAFTLTEKSQMTTIRCRGILLFPIRITKGGQILVILGGNNMLTICEEGSHSDDIIPQTPPPLSLLLSTILTGNNKKQTNCVQQRWGPRSSFWSTIANL